MVCASWQVKHVQLFFIIFVIFLLPSPSRRAFGASVLSPHAFGVSVQSHARLACNSHVCPIAIVCPRALGVWLLRSFVRSQFIVPLVWAAVASSVDPPLMTWMCGVVDRFGATLHGVNGPLIAHALRGAFQDLHQAFRTFGIQDNMGFQA